MADWHTDQFREPKRATLALRDFIARHIPPATNALDAGCGAGASIHHLRSLAANWTGIDRDAELLAIGRRHVDADLVHGDLTRLPFSTDQFDLTISVMVLSWLPDYRQAMREMLRVTDGWVIVTSLFADSALDAYVQVRGDEYHAHYNVYSLPRFKAFCETTVICEPFEIDIDLPRPTHGHMETWTERTADGRRLQFSGPVHMPWWFLAIKSRRSTP